MRHQRRGTVHRTCADGHPSRLDGAIPRRGLSEPEDPWHDRVRSIVAAPGGDATLAQHHAALERILTERPNAVLVTSSEGAIEQTYRSLIESLK